LLQFRDLLDALSNSYSSGMNTQSAFNDAYKDLEKSFGKNAPIVKELSIILKGLNNNFLIEELLRDMAARCGIDDIKSFADTFAVCSRLGGDLKRIVKESRDIISEKIEIEMEIETTVSANKNEIDILCVMPFVMVTMLGRMSQGGTSILTNTPVNVVVKFFAIFLFAVAYKIGMKICDIKV
jgi:tight adherence protein B